MEENEFGNDVPRYDFLENGNWDAFYKVSVFLAILANLYTFLVAYVWLMIIAIFIYFFLFICLFFLCSNDNNR